WPRCLASGSATMRAMISVPPPGPAPIIMRTGRVGQSCASAGRAIAINVAAAAAKERERAPGNLTMRGMRFSRGTDAPVGVLVDFSDWDSDGRGAHRIADETDPGAPRLHRLVGDDLALAALHRAGERDPAQELHGAGALRHQIRRRIGRQALGLTRGHLAEEL